MGSSSLAAVDAEASAREMDPDRQMVVEERRRCHRCSAGIASLGRRSRRDRPGCLGRERETDCEQEHRCLGVADEDSDGESDDAAGGVAVVVDDGNDDFVVAVAVDGSDPALAGRWQPSRRGR